MRAILLYVAACYGLAIALSLAIGFTGGHGSALIGLGYLSMFLPAAAVAIVAVMANEPPRLCWAAFSGRYLPAALFLIPGLLHAAMLPAMSLWGGGVRWQGWLTPGADGLYHAPASRGWGDLTLPALAGRILANAAIGLAVVSLLAVFEEIGWRAWLLPRLADRMGARRGVVVTSVIWAVWHVPFQLSGIQHIDGVSPARLAVSMPLGIAATGLILGWLWLRTESIWLVAIAHGAANNWGQYAFKYMRDSGSPERDLFVVTIGSLAVLAAGLILLWKTDLVRARANSSCEPR